MRIQVRSILSFAFLCCFVLSISTTCAQNNPNGALRSTSGNATNGLTGLHYTPEEVAIWQIRAQNGPYKIKKDVSPNSPGDWDRIVKNANKFLLYPANERWTVLPDQKTCILRKQGDKQFQPQNKGEQIRDAAFVDLVNGTSVYTEAIRTTLLWQAAEPSTDFSDTTRWCKGELTDQGTGFWHALWMNRLFFTYDYVKNKLSAEDRATLEAWFYQAAIYFQKRNVDYHLNRIFVNRAAGNHEISSYGRKVKVDQNSATKTYYQGNAISNLATWYNNRRGAMLQFVACVGIHRNDASMIKSAKLYVKEFVKYSVFPDGTIGEFQRGTGAASEQGWQYGLTVVEQCLNVADMLARKGDFELYEYTTSEGLGTTAGGNKSLFSATSKMLSFLDGTSIAYNTTSAAEVGNKAFRIDGIDSVNNRAYTFDIWIAQANIYFKDSTIKSIYTRTKAGTNPYPVRAASSGLYNAWTGGFGLFPGKLFMFGQMEDKVNPYPGRPSQTVPKIKGKGGSTTHLKDKK